MAVSQIFLLKHQSQISRATLLHGLEWVPPILLINVTAVILSSCKRMCTPSSLAQSAWRPSQFSCLEFKTIIFSNFLGKPSASSWSHSILVRTSSFQGGICCQCKIGITVRNFLWVLETFLYPPPNI